MTPDPRPTRRQRDPDAYRRARLLHDECAACGRGDVRLSLHHVVYGRDGRDDDIRNLLLVCGDGVRGCHGRYHAADEKTRRALGRAVARRPDTVRYAVERLGGVEEGVAYLEGRYLLRADEFLAALAP